MTCDDCIHKSVCYRRIESVSTSYADKCGDFESDDSIEPFKPMVEIDLYSVIKQKYIEREVLDKIRAEIEQVAEEESKFNIKGARGLKHALKIINKYKAEMEKSEEDKESYNDGWCNTCEYKYIESKCVGCAKYDEYDNLITLSKYKKESEE